MATNDDYMQSSPVAVVQVHLLVSKDGLFDYASVVCQKLASRYGLNHVVVRSATLPIEQLLLLAQSSTHNDDDKSKNNNIPVLFVYLSDGDPSTITAARISILEAESSIPVLSLDTATDVTRTTTSNQDPDDVALSIAKFCSLTSSSLRRKVAEVLVAHQQARIIRDAQFKTKSPFYLDFIAQCYEQKQLLITGDKITVPGRQRGKVRDRYAAAATTTATTIATAAAADPSSGQPETQSTSSPVIALVTTDRHSSFDRLLAKIPFKGAVLNLTSAYWFNQTRHIIPNHCVSIPHPNITLAQTCQPFPIEFVVRSYVTGSTSTSIWKNYQAGMRNYCGHDLPEGMSKNQKLPQTLLTPTTKEEDHDRLISVAEIISEQWMTEEDINVCSKAALDIFALGQEIAARRGLILVDTKYEFGRNPVTGQILLIDEVHTPDSSRYWLASTYEERLAAGKEPDNIDKEFLRLWFKDNCDPYNDAVLPDAPSDLVIELSRRYIMLYELISGQSFDFSQMTGEQGIQKALEQNLQLI